MRNFVTVIAAISVMLSAAPMTTAYAADTVSASVTSEASLDNVSMEQLAGQWKYQISDTNYDVEISSKDNGTVVISKDGTYTYTDASGKTSTGTVKLGFEIIGGTSLQTVGFYEGSEHKFGGYYHNEEPDALYLGNNRISHLVRKGSAEVSLSDFTGTWKYQESNGGYPVDVSAKCRAVFVLENGSWKMSSCTTGDFKNENVTASQTAVRVSGDANCDGGVDMSDVVLIMQALSNPNKYGENGTAELHITAQGIANADTNGDGLTVGDAQAIQKALLDLG